MELTPVISRWFRQKRIKLPLVSKSLRKHNIRILLRDIRQDIEVFRQINELDKKILLIIENDLESKKSFNQRHTVWINMRGEFDDYKRLHESLDSIKNIVDLSFLKEQDDIKEVLREFEERLRYVKGVARYSHVIKRKIEKNQSNIEYWETILEGLNLNNLDNHLKGFRRKDLNNELQRLENWFLNIRKDMKKQINEYKSMGRILKGNLKPILNILKTIKKNEKKLYNSIDDKENKKKFTRMMNKIKNTLERRQQRESIIISLMQSTAAKSKKIRSITGQAKRKSRQLTTP